MVCVRGIPGLAQTGSPSHATRQSPVSTTLPNVEDIDAILEPAVGEVSGVCLSLASQRNILGGIDCAVVGGHHNDRRPCGKQSRKMTSAPHLPRILGALLALPFVTEDKLLSGLEGLKRKL